MTTHTLNFPADNFDKSTYFTFEIPSFRKGGEPRKRTGYLFFAPDENKTYVMQAAAVMQGSYSEKDRADLDRLESLTPVKAGDTVVVEGKTYTVSKLGDFSDAGTLIPA